MMNGILCLNPGERRPLKVFQVAPGTQPIDCAQLLRLGLTVAIASDDPACIEIIETESGWICAAPDEAPQGQLVTLTAAMRNASGEVVALGGIMAMVVPVGWAVLQDLAIAPGPPLAEGQDEPSRIVLAN